MLGKRSYGLFSDIGTRCCPIDHKAKRLLGLLHHLRHHNHGAQVVWTRTRGDSGLKSAAVFAASIVEFIPIRS